MGYFAGYNFHKKLFRLWIPGLGIGAGLSFVFFVSTFFEIQDRFNPELAAVRAVNTGIAPQGFPSWDDYAGIIKGRNIFLPFEEKKLAQADQPAAFRIAGLMLGQRPSVVLEDARRGQTLFLTEGEKRDQIYVKKVSRDGVILDIAGESVVLNMKGQM